MVGVGFFAPLPLAMMIPFMATQSMIMGDAFGKSYQYGKRKISSMSNEEFNKLTPQQLATEIATDYRQAIPSMQQAIIHSRDFQSLIIKEMAEIIKSLPEDLVSAFVGSDAGQTVGSNLKGNTEGWSAIIKAILDAIKGATNPFPPAYGTDLEPTEDPGNLPTSTETRTFREQMESLTNAQLIDAYNNRHQRYDTKQQQIIVLVHRLRFGKTLPPEDVVIIPTEEEQTYIQWFNQLMKLGQVALASLNKVKSTSSSAANQSIRQILKSQNLRDVKAIQNHISLGRNSRNREIVSDSAQKWRDRWWKQFSYQ